MILDIYYVEDNPRSGRPKTSQPLVDLILATVTKNSTTRMFSCGKIAAEVAKELKKNPLLGILKALSTSTVY